MAGVRSADRGRRTQGRYGAPRGGSGFATHGQEPARGGRRRSSRAKFRRVFPRVSVLRMDFEVQLATRSREAPRRVVRSSDQPIRRGSLDHVFRAPGDGLVVAPRACPFAVGIARASGFERRPSVIRAGSGEAARTLGWFELARRRPARFHARRRRATGSEPGRSTKDAIPNQPRLVTCDNSWLGDATPRARRAETPTRERREASELTRGRKPERTTGQIGARRKRRNVFV